MTIPCLQFIKFSIVGFTNALVAYSVYFCLTYLGIHYIIANIIAFAVGVLNSFFWSSRFVFKKKTGEYRNPFYTLAKTYLAYAITGLILSNILLYVFVEIISISKYIAPLLSLVITVPTNFIINKEWAYKIQENKYEKN